MGKQTPKPETDLTPNRLLAGAITLACFAGAIAMRWFGYSENQELAYAGLIRVGVFMAAFWFALPSKSRFAAWKGLSPWVVVMLALGIFFLPRLKFSIPIFIGLFFLCMLIKPKKRPAKTRKTTIETTTTKTTDSK